ncbi:oxaloacetate decarboxylase [Pseudidiomarina gelatinasegens]|jgi:oxaloacetate decarboxylase gamma subunit|uniref:Probable oxaloacetate decarboxylase gamma chain n=1 Tax=Pseudidiomarina gelatinasegens TaxID=2487740 RepID=A0A451GF14_9GAMM|nr:OadG family transporter subunit [Pseudidiomarina gelatinasegens]RWU11713.1 oxaloacetate decarboxylase [Pseudidiomarina gelatinasegens]
MTDLFSEAFTIMVTGMVTVFVFLSLLLGAMALLRLIADAPEPAVGGSSSAQEPTPAQLAAITAAIHQYRRK